MKTGTIAIILGGIIAGAVIFALNVPTQEEHYRIRVTGLKDVYLVGEPFTFGYTISGYGYSCGDKEIHIPDSDGDSQIMRVLEQCDSSQPKNEFTYRGRTQGERGNTIFEHPGINTPTAQHISVTYEHGGFEPTVGGKQFHVVEKICSESDAKNEAECFADAYDSCTSAYIQQIKTHESGHVQQVTGIVYSWYDCTLRVYTEFLHVNETGMTETEVHDYNLDKRSNCEGITLNEDSWTIHGCTNEPDDITINYSEKREAQYLCQLYDGTWNEEFAACFDYSEKFDCQRYGGDIVKRAYTAADYEKIRDSSDACKFRK